MSFTFIDLSGMVFNIFNDVVVLWVKLRPMNQTRRELIKHLGVLALISGAQIKLLADEKADKDFLKSGFVLQPEDHETYLITQRKAPVTIMVNKERHGVGIMSFCKEVIAPGDYIPIHKHGQEDELIYIEAGAGTFLLGETKHTVSQGSVAHVPPGVWHGLLNNGNTPIIMVFAYTPSGFENYFREIGTRPNEPMKEITAEEYARINLKYQMEYKHFPPAWE